MRRRSRSTSIARRWRGRPEPADASPNNLLVTLNTSAQTSPNFWINPRNSVSYPLVVQMPTYRINSTQDLWTLPVTRAAGRSSDQMLMNVAKFGRTKVPMVVSQLNIRPVFDVNADVQGRDLTSAADAIDKVIAADRPDPRNRGSPSTLQRAGRDHAGELFRTVLRHGARGGSGLSCFWSSISRAGSIR